MRIEAGTGRGGLALGRKWGAAREAERGREVTAYIQFLTGASPGEAGPTAVQEEPATKETLASALGPPAKKADTRGPQGGQGLHFGGQGVAIDRAGDVAGKGDASKATVKPAGPAPPKTTLFQKLDVSARLLGRKKGAEPAPDHAREFDQLVTRSLDIVGLVT